MPATSPAPGPDGPSPLSEREQRELDEVERRLTATEPDFVARFGAAQRDLPREWSTLDRLVGAAIVGGVTVLVLPAEWLAVIAVVAVLLGPLVVSPWLRRSAR